MMKPLILSTAVAALATHALGGPLPPPGAIEIPAPGPEEISGVATLPLSARRICGRG